MPETHIDDPTISDDSFLWRWIHPLIIVRDEKSPSGWRLSSQAFVDSGDKTPCSVVLAAETWPLDEVIQKRPEFSVAQITAGDARAVEQSVLRWEDPELPGHAYVAGRKTKPVRNTLAAKGRWVGGGRNWDSPTPVE
jgi:hypothetical protein